MLRTSDTRLSVTILVDAVGQLPALTIVEARVLERAIRNRQRCSPGVRVTWTAAEEKQLARLLDQGMSDRKIAEALDRSPWSIRSRIRSLSAKLDKTDRRQRWTPETEGALIAKRKEGKSIVTIAKEMEMNRWTVTDKLRRLRLQGRV